MTKQDKIRAKKQTYPKFQLKMEKYQMQLNKAAVNSDMKTVGKYNVLINQLWDHHYKEWRL